MFHYKNGFYIKKNKDGSVYLEQRIDATDNSPIIFAITIDKDSWISIIKSLT